jgi:hypothetical protein
MNNKQNTTNNESALSDAELKNMTILRDAALLIWRALPASLRTPEGLKTSEETR